MPSGMVGAGEAPVRHDTVIVAGCMVHTPMTPEALDWISRTMRCDETAEDPPAGAFHQFRATLRVQTFDDIDICAKIANRVLRLGGLAGIGFRELLVNAVEHGNLGISFDEKSELLETGRWREEVERRFAVPAYRDKYATVTLFRDSDEFAIDIEDQGDGFDWQKYVNQPSDTPQAHLHGRGLPLAMSAGFDVIEYRGCGNAVFLRGRCEPPND